MFISFQIPKTYEEKKYSIIASTTGCFLGLVGKSIVSVLTGASLTALSLCGWGLVGLVAGLAISFFKKEEPVFTRVILTNNELITQSKDLWNAYIAEQINNNLNYEDRTKVASLFLKEGDTFEEIWAVEHWSKIIIEFSKAKNNELNTSLECWNYAKDHLKDFVDNLITMKLASLTELGPHQKFFANYMAVSIVTKEIAGGKQNREPFEENIRKHLDFMTSCFANA